MKKLLTLLFVGALIALALTHSAKAENSTGNVSSGLYVSDVINQSTVIRAGFNWWESDSGGFIGVIYYDTVPGRYQYLADSSVFTAKDGSFYVNIPTNKSCMVYYFKFIVIDKLTGKKSTEHRMITTPNKEKAVLLGFNLSQIGFNFAEVQFSFNEFCDYADFELKCSESGKLPFITITRGQDDYKTSLKKLLSNLDPNTEYSISFRLFFPHRSDLGETIIAWGFRTLSNLPPVVESNSAIDVKNESATVTAWIDPRNTWNSESEVRYGEHITLEQKTGWTPVQQKGNYGFYLPNLKPNTVYFWNSFARNDYGNDNGETKMFKTNEFATAVTEITSDDLLQVSSCPAGIRIYPEKDAIVEIYSITGQKVLTTNLRGGEAHIFSSLTPGVYIVKSFIEGYTVAKKSIVN